MTKILIADDHNMFINGLKLLLSSVNKYEIIGVANNGLEVLAILEKQEVNVILMDVNMPVLNGYHATKEIKKVYPKIKIIILSMLVDELSVKKLMEAGADGYLFKNTDEEELFESLNAVCNGEFYIAKEIRDKICLSKHKKLGVEENVKLSSREIDISKLIIEGLTNTEIADKLFLSYRTVETHRKNILAKLNIKNTAALVKYLIDNKPFLGL